MAADLKELNLTKRQRRAVMMVHGAEQITPTEAGQARRNAWPDFVPVEMAERFLNENEQVDKVINAELEPIQEEFKTT